jgi:hypothetical protein
MTQNIFSDFLRTHLFCHVTENEVVPTQKSENLVAIKAREKLNRRHMVDILRIQFFAQHRYRANWSFMDGHEETILAKHPGWAKPLRVLHQRWWV